MNYARIGNARVIEIYTPRVVDGVEVPVSKMFHPDYLAECIHVLDTVEVGDVFDGSNFTKPLPEPEPDAAIGARVQRDTLLADSDWSQLPDVPESTRATWAPYRQALRDVPAQKGFPKKIKWPEAPQ